MNKYSISIALVTSAVLAACGGGSGGSGSASTPVVTPTPTPTPSACAAPAPSTATSVGAITLLAAPGKSANSYVASGNDTADARNFLNGVRSELGLQSMTDNVALDQAAANHAGYLQQNNTTGHDEVPTNPGFTGADPATRTNAADPANGGISGEVVAWAPGQTGDFLSRNLFDAPLHRTLMMADFKYQGVAVNSGHLVADFSSLNASPVNQLVAYPYQGQTGVRVFWQDFESPDPLAGTTFSGQLVGYPLVLLGGLGSQLTLTAFTLNDACGTAVPLITRDHTSTAVQIENNVILAIPAVTGLSVNTAYTAHATGTYTAPGSTTATPLDITWSFTTGAH
ncbi:CAP domain-containing protein [Silvimonas soli]|uniref:CAP domain-containing protein n=1 Tax=Silvimonas soli TaxID=2980100 RepID=UPI0024B329F9|nr:CAP domain-containing protein [Silvimonas soli]